MQQSYQDVIAGRKARESRDSALMLSKKWKKKTRKDRKDSSVSGSDSSDEESVFRLASLPEGVDKLRELRERKPGHLANVLEATKVKEQARAKPIQTQLH